MIKPKTVLLIILKQAQNGLNLSNRLKNTPCGHKPKFEFRFQILTADLTFSDGLRHSREGTDMAVIFDLTHSKDIFCQNDRARGI